MLGSAVKPPSNLAVAISSKNSVSLSWIDNSANETAYRIERSTDGSYFYLIGSGLPANATNYSDTNLVSGTTYYYRVWCSNGTLRSGYSNVASVTMPAIPAAPSGLTATVLSNSQIKLQWADNSNNEQYFLVERSTDNVNFSQVVILAATPPQRTLTRGSQKRSSITIG